MWNRVIALTFAVTVCGCQSDGTPPVSGSSEGSTSAAGSSGAMTSDPTPSTGTPGPTTQAADTSTGEEPPPANPCEPGPDATIELGHGEVIFETFDAHPAELIYGVQGGYHIVVGVRGMHTDNSGESVLRMRAFIDGEELAFSAPYVELVCIDGMQQAVNLLLIWDTTPDALHGKTAFIQAELTDAAGAVYLTEGEVVINDPTME